MLASLSKRLLMTLPNRRHISTADTSPRSNETNLRGRWRRNEKEEVEEEEEEEEEEGGGGGGGRRRGGRRRGRWQSSIRSHFSPSTCRSHILFLFLRRYGSLLPRQHLHTCILLSTNLHTCMLTCIAHAQHMHMHSTCTCTIQNTYQYTNDHAL